MDGCSRGGAESVTSTAAELVSRPTGELDGERVVAALAAAVARLGAVHELDAVLQAIVTGAVDAVPGAEHAGISLVSNDGSITSRAPTDERVDALDQLQTETGEGPCLDAIAIDRTVVVVDLHTETSRWPAFAPRAIELGAGSVLSFRLFTDTAPLAALNIYASAPAAFDDESRLLGELFASHAAIALADAQHVEHLDTALTNRDVIGQAKGILMERFGITAHEAFNMLVASSQDTNLKLVAIARWLTGGTAPG